MGRSAKRLGTLEAVIVVRIRARSPPDSFVSKHTDINIRVRRIKKIKCLFVCFFESESEYGWTGKEREAHKSTKRNSLINNETKTRKRFKRALV